MNTDDRADALTRLAALYEVDLDSPGFGGRRVLEYLACPEGISAYIEVIRFPGGRDLDGEVLMPGYFELRAGFEEPWRCVETAEREYDLDLAGDLVAVVDLDGWSALRRSPSGWSFHDLPV